MGFTFYALGILAYSAIMVSGKAVSWALAWLGMLIFTPMMIWELWLGLWLLINGSNE